MRIVRASFAVAGTAHGAENLGAVSSPSRLGAPVALSDDGDSEEGDSGSTETGDAGGHLSELDVVGGVGVGRVGGGAGGEKRRTGGESAVHVTGCIGNRMVGQWATMWDHG